MLPGWDSFELTSAFAKYLTWAGFATLLLLGIVEIFAHVYSVHETTLKDALVEREAAQSRAESDTKLAAANLELERLKARTEFRHLTPDQQQSIREKMKQFSGIEFAVLAYNAGDDSTAIAGDIRAALEGPSGAGWKLMHSGGIALSPPETGILIEVNPDAPRVTLRAASALADALRHEGILVPVVRPYRVPGALEKWLASNLGSIQIVISIQRRP